MASTRSCRVAIVQSVKPRPRWAGGRHLGRVEVRGADDAASSPRSAKPLPAVPLLPIPHQERRRRRRAHSQYAKRLLRQPQGRTPRPHTGARRSSTARCFCVNWRLGHLRHRKRLLTSKMGRHDGVRQLIPQLLKDSSWISHFVLPELADRPASTSSDSLARTRIPRRRCGFRRQRPRTRRR